MRGKRRDKQPIYYMLQINIASDADDIGCDMDMTLHQGINQCLPFKKNEIASGQFVIKIVPLPNTTGGDASCSPGWPHEIYYPGAM